LARLAECDSSRRRCSLTQLVSILIPCHNAAPYIGAAIDSALGQTWKNLEIIVVNDGSTDSSDEILKRYVERGVRVIDQENAGQCAAANHALRAAQGEYVKFFDADDLLHPRVIEMQIQRLQGAPNDVASSEWGRFYGDDRTTFRSNPESVWRDMEARDWLVESWRYARPMMQCALWLIPRGVLERAGGWDEELSLINDFEFFARLLAHAENVHFTPGCPLYYRSGLQGSLSGRKSRIAVESAFHSLMRGTQHLLNVRDDADARLSCANVLQDFIYTYYPDHADLRAKMQARIDELGGSDLPPDGPPRFQHLRRFTGWKVARRIQRWVRR
jgi:glycosyltransferase involved in cell wall biosynthesis